MLKKTTWLLVGEITTLIPTRDEIFNAAAHTKNLAHATANLETITVDHLPHRKTADDPALLQKTVAVLATRTNLGGTIPTMVAVAETIVMTSLPANLAEEILATHPTTVHEHVLATPMTIGETTEETTTDEMTAVIEIGTETLSGTDSVMTGEATAATTTMIVMADPGVGRRERSGRHKQLHSLQPMRFRTFDEKALTGCERKHSGT